MFRWKKHLLHCPTMSSLQVMESTLKPRPVEISLFQGAPKGAPGVPPTWLLEIRGRESRRKARKARFSCCSFAREPAQLLDAMVSSKFLQRGTSEESLLDHMIVHSRTLQHMEATEKRVYMLHLKTLSIEQKRGISKHGFYLSKKRFVATSSHACSPLTKYTLSFRHCAWTRSYSE